MFVIEGKVAFVTGALGGIGRFYVKSLLENGIRGVALVDLNSRDAVTFQIELEVQFGAGKTIFIKTDVADSFQVKDALEKTVDHFKQLDIVINNAGIVDEVDIHKCISVNLSGAALITRLAFTEYLPKYKKGKEAVVVNTASIAGLEPLSTAPTYAATKAGLVSLGLSYGQLEHYERNCVKIMTICPSGTDTPMLESRKDLPKDLLDLVEKIPFAESQRPESLGSALIKVLKEGDTESVWIVQKDQPATQVNCDVFLNYINSLKLYFV